MMDNVDVVNSTATNDSIQLSTSKPVNSEMDEKVNVNVATKVDGDGKVQNSLEAGTMSQSLTETIVEKENLKSIKKETANIETTLTTTKPPVTPATSHQDSPAKLLTEVSKEDVYKLLKEGRLSFEKIPKLPKKVVRIFLSSTFTGNKKYSK